MSTAKEELEQRILDAGYEEVMLLDNYSYESAFVGITTDNRAVYDYDLMVEWLVDTQGFTRTDAIEWIDYNTLRALPYMGSEAPIIINRIE